MTKLNAAPLSFAAPVAPASASLRFAGSREEVSAGTTPHSAADVILDIDERGIIRACSENARGLLGYRPIELEGEPVGVLLPGIEDSPGSRGGRIGQRLKFLGHCGISFRARRIDGRQIPCRLFVHNRHDACGSTLRLILRRDDSHNDVCI